MKRALFLLLFLGGRLSTVPLLRMPAHAGRFFLGVTALGSVLAAISCMLLSHVGFLALAGRDTPPEHARIPHLIFHNIDTSGQVFRIWAST